MDVTQVTPSSTTPLRPALTSARRALDVANLVLTYDGAESGALVEALTRAWDAGAAAGEAGHPKRYSSRRPEFTL